MPLRFAIVDDEAPARMVLREYLSSDTDVQVVAECANGFEAVKAVAELHPDLLFLDVQMPKLDGFEVLDLVGRDVAVVFTTAYDEYALKAFEVQAGDKPRLKEQTLASLEGQLDPRRFVRIHRSYLLNLDRLARLESVSKDARMAILRDGRRLPVSRAGFARLQELL